MPSRSWVSSVGCLLSSSDAHGTIKAIPPHISLPDPIWTLPSYSSGCVAKEWLKAIECVVQIDLENFVI